MTDDPTWLCQRGSRCTDARTETITAADGTTTRARQPARAVTAGMLCRTDTSILRTALTQLPMDYLELSTMLAKGSASDAPVSGTRELPVPLRLGVLALADQLLDETERWAEAVAEATGFWYRPEGTRHERMARAAGWCAGLADRLQQLPETWQARLDGGVALSGRDTISYALESGMDGALTLLDLHEQVAALGGRTRRSEHLMAPCPECSRRALEHEEGASHVTCRRCWHRMPLDRYETHCAGVLAAAYERHPRETPPKPRRRAARDRPTVWGDGTAHHRVDSGSNMMLRYIERYDARTVAA